MHPIPEQLIFDADAPIAMAAMARGAYLLDQPLLLLPDSLEQPVCGRSEDVAKLRQKYEMHDAMYGVIYPMLLRMGVPQESVSALLDEAWINISRHVLRSYGGSRIKTFETEMRHFRYTYKDPSVGYSLFKYAVVGAATLSVPPRQFYRLRDWYGRKNLGRLREYFATAGHPWDHK